MSTTLRTLTKNELRLRSTVCDDSWCVPVGIRSSQTRPRLCASNIGKPVPPTRIFLTL
jgi:hypothetical protein